MEKVYITNSAEETTELARKVVKELLHKGRIFALFGELGSGKTTFVQGLARGLGIKRRIISPTFVFIRQYKISPLGHLGGGEATTSTPARCNTFYHIDLYRIESEGEVKGLGLEEIINDPQNIVAIEWAEKMGELLPKERINIIFEYLDENKRKIWTKV